MNHTPHPASPNALQEGLAKHLTPAQRACLAAARVGIAGCGGLGSNVAAMLVRSGVGTLVLADDDAVEPSNLNRQLFWPAHVGTLKVEALAEQLALLAPGVQLIRVPQRLTPHNIATVFAGCTVVVEALDKAEAKAMCYTALRQSTAFYVGASGLGGWGGPPLEVRRLGSRAVMVGDFTTPAEGATPPMAPRVTWAAAMQADAVINYLLRDAVPQAPCKGRDAP